MTLDIRRLTPTYAVAPQIDPSDLPALKAAGYVMVIDNRPDGELGSALGAMIGAAGGALQSASRTMMLRHTTPEQATEAFGLYALSGKVASFMTPLLIGLFTHFSQSARIGIAPVILLFLIALILLLWVNPKGENG